MIFRLETRDRGYVYMRVSRSNYCNDERAVVEVDSDKFLALWRRSPQNKNSGEIGWRAERKYPMAESGFSAGLDSPVPLAHPHIRIHVDKIPIYAPWLFLFRRVARFEEKTFEFIDFTDGVTRTLWLLQNGVKVFPVECPLSEADQMQRAVGLPGGRYWIVEELLPFDF